jgi:hypothetical protein
MNIVHKKGLGDSYDIINFLKKSIKKIKIIMIN